MRAAVWGRIGPQRVSHMGHGYDVVVPPLGLDGKPDVDARDAWLKQCEQVTLDEDYHQFFDRWVGSFFGLAGLPGAQMREARAEARVLVGQGNPSGADVGLTVHRTWGVPVLPGSALKGVLANYVDATYGDDDPTAPDAAERRAWRGPTWTDRRVRSGAGAGKHFVSLFGAPEEDGVIGSARGGEVEFHDALYVPGSAGRPDRPYATDVLTVHQKSYYDSAGRVAPTDWDSPNPVGFLTVKPGSRFLIALTGTGQWPALALRLLGDALAEWGIGAKTSAGYGRLKMVPSSAEEAIRRR